MSSTALILQHDPSIHLGNIGPVLTEHGYDLRVVDVTREDVAAIDPREADLVVVLGGEMGAYQTDEFPFLAAEQELLRDRLDAELPTLGVCLGAQLMVGALGERVYKGDTTQIGFRRVEPTEAGADSPVRHFAGVPVVEWHGDTFELPERATLLASSSDYSNEAFAIGDFALAERYRGDPLASLEGVNDQARCAPLFPLPGQAPRLAAELMNLATAVRLGAAILRGLGRGSEAEALRASLLAGLATAELKEWARRELDLPGTITREIVDRQMAQDCA